MIALGLSNPPFAISISSFIHLLLLACTPATTSTTLHDAICSQLRRDGTVGEADIVSRWPVHCWNVAFRGQSEASEDVFGSIRVVYD